MMSLFDWLREPDHRVKMATTLLWVSVVAWPATALTIFKDEPQGILGLSWFAVILTCIDIVVTTDVRKEVENDNEATEGGGMDLDPLSPL